MAWASRRNLRKRLPQRRDPDRGAGHSTPQRFQQPVARRIESRGFSGRAPAIGMRVSDSTPVRSPDVLRGGGGTEPKQRPSFIEAHVAVRRRSQLRHKPKRCRCCGACGHTQHAEPPQQRGDHDPRRRRRQPARSRRGAREPERAQDQKSDDDQQKCFCEHGAVIRATDRYVITPEPGRPRSVRGAQNFSGSPSRPGSLSTISRSRTS